VDIALGRDGDLLLTDGRVRVVEGAAALVQRLKVRLRLLQGEFFLAPSAGFPWLDVLQQRFDETSLRARLGAYLAETQGVRSVAITELRRRPNRTLHVRFVVTAADGTLADGATEVSL
jgi:hypothetical protein